MIARAGIVLAVLQLAFGLTWVVYVAYLPALAAQVGLPASIVPWLLLADQAIFVVCDWTAGVFADRIEASLGRLGLWLALVTLASCAAFLAMPFVAPFGSAPLVIALVIVWSATSSILRAPTLALAGRHASRPQRTWLSGLYLLGFGAAGAVAPSLAKTLATTDPRIPFVATSVIVAAMTIVLAALPRAAPVASAPIAPARPPAPSISLAPFAGALLLFAIGFQVHAAINSIPMYLRYATRDQLVTLLPVFWLGFNVAMLLVMVPVRRAGGLVVMIGGGAIGAAALLVARLGDSLALLVAAQAFAGVAWAGILGGAFAATTTLSRKPGGATGLVFSMLAGATVLRIALVTTQLAASPTAADLTPIVPPIAWLLGAVVVATFAFRRHPV
jgi:MFS family permease